jgi:hypothetical protein
MKAWFLFVAALNFLILPSSYTFGDEGHSPSAPSRPIATDASSQGTLRDQLTRQKTQLEQEERDLQTVKDQLEYARGIRNASLIVIPLGVATEVAAFLSHGYINPDSAWQGAATLSTIIGGRVIAMTGVGMLIAGSAQKSMLEKALRRAEAVVAKKRYLLKSLGESLVKSGSL